MWGGSLIQPGRFPVPGAHLDDGGAGTYGDTPVEAERPGLHDLRRNFAPTNPGKTRPRVRWLGVNPHDNPAGAYAFPLMFWARSRRALG